MFIFKIIFYLLIFYRMHITENTLVIEILFENFKSTLKERVLLSKIGMNRNVVLWDLKLCKYN